MMTALPDVALVAFGTVCHDLMAKAVLDSVRQCSFADVLVWSDRDLRLPGIPTRPFQCSSQVEADRFWWKQAWKPVKVSHFLTIQWDSWVVDASMWRPEFLEFDYIGAPWWYRDGWNVGNGGFSLRSRRLAEHVARNGTIFPLQFPEDVALCRRYRGLLEADGFRWAPDDVAIDFAFECVRPSLTSPHFGFHAFRNFPFVLDRERLHERIALADNWALRDDQFDRLKQNVHSLEAAGIPLGYCPN